MARFAHAQLSVALLLLGCSETAPERTELGTNSAPIVNGALDTAHQAVVAVLGSQSACSGTIVAVSGNQGYVLTAAHCMSDPPQYVVQADDYNSSSAVLYGVVAYQSHPNFNASQLSYDFAMVRFTGATAATPRIAAMSPAEDALARGTVLDFVGYGTTPNTNTRRRHLSLSLDQVTSLQVTYLLASGGPCAGDGGGPGIQLLAAGERVAAVSSYGDQNCNVEGVAGRVSSVYSSFIRPFIDGTDGGSEPDSGVDGSAGAADGAAGRSDGSVDGAIDGAGAPSDASGGAAGGSDAASGGGAGTAGSGASGGSTAGTIGAGGSAGRASGGAAGSGGSRSGSQAPAEDEGCSCSVVGKSRRPSALMLSALLLGLLYARRKRIARTA